MSKTTEITNRLINWLLRKHSSSTILPRYNPQGWWEADVFELTSANYFVEYEIKISMADFKKDIDKHKRAWNDEKKKMDYTYKHELLADSAVFGPCRFWYVMPEKLAATIVGKNLLPKYAGLISVKDDKRYSPDQIKKAPQLHRKKIEKDIKEHIFKCGYFRYIYNL